MRRYDLFTAIACIAAAVIAVAVMALLFPPLFGRDIMTKEILAIGLGVAILVQQLRAHRNRRERDRLDGMRDSALW